MDTSRESVWMPWRIQILLLLVLAASTISVAQTLRLAVTNPEPYARPGEIVALRWDELGGVFSSIDPASISVTTFPEGVALPVQPTGEELLVQVDLGAGQSREFLVHSKVPPIPPVASRVDGLFVLPREDFAWENDRIAFRVYGPALAGEVNNGIDVWTKRVRSLIVQKWYRESEGSSPGKDNYHVDRGEGADFFT